MTPHIQHHLNKPDVQFGSCYPTIYACLLDIPVIDVPHFNLLYWTPTEKYNITKYLEDRFLEGVQASEFVGEKYRMDNFDNHLSISEWLWENVRQFWLAGRGYKETYIKDIDAWLAENPGAYYIATGKSIRGVDHVVVYQYGQMVHDPHPSAAGVIKVDKYSFLQKL